MHLPAFDLTRHASEVVCVAIGINLLLPVAPAIARRFFDGIDVDPDKIIGKKFRADLQDFLDEKDIQKIGVCAVSIMHRQSKRDASPGLAWRILDVLFACIGVFLLWSGWIDNPCVAKFCALLFIPPLVAAGWPFACFLCAFLRLNFHVAMASFHAWRKKRRIGRKKNVDATGAEIDDFVEKAKAAIAERREAGSGECSIKR